MGFCKNISKIWECEYKDRYGLTRDWEILRVATICSLSDLRRKFGGKYLPKERERWELESFEIFDTNKKQHLSCPFLLYELYDSSQGRLLQLQSLPRVKCNVSHDFTFPWKTSLNCWKIYILEALARSALKQRSSVSWIKVTTTICRSFARWPSGWLKCFGSNGEY